MVEKAHIQEVYKNRSFHVSVSTLTQAYDMLDELDRHGLSQRVLRNVAWTILVRVSVFLVSRLERLMLPGAALVA